MSFLSSILGNRDDDENEELDEDPGIKGLPQLTKGMTLLVTYAENDAPLLSGRMSGLTDGVLTLERAPGQFSFDVCPLNTRVYIRGISGTTHFDLKGTVVLSNRIQLKVNQLQVLPHNELRGNFRLPISTPVTLYYQDDSRFQNPEKCLLVNMSTGGACVESEFIHTEGEILRLRVQIEEYAPMSFLGQIIRVEEPRKGVFRYGFLFAQLSEQETASLTRLLYNLQVGNRRMWRRNPDTGIWE